MMDKSRGMLSSRIDGRRMEESGHVEHRGRVKEEEFMCLGTRYGELTC